MNVLIAVPVLMLAVAMVVMMMVRHRRNSTW
jgi:hypothetical protein